MEEKYETLAKKNKRITQKKMSETTKKKQKIYQGIKREEGGGRGKKIGCDAEREKRETNI